MAKLTFLGTASAVPDENHENTYFVIEGEGRFILVDSASNPIVRLGQAGLDYRDLTDIYLTHFHPDHISGIPLFLMNMWLLGRQRHLNLYGLHATLDRLEKLMGFFDWGKWPEFFPVAFHRLPAENMTLAQEDEDFRIFTSPVNHMIPTMGLRVELRKNNKVIAYSCDTEPCPQVEELAAKADLLIHEATGEFPGHSSAYQAGEVAQKAGAKCLYLIHYDPKDADPPTLIDQAKAAYDGKVVVAEDFMEIEL
jgi:ribonuclease Z